METRRNLWKQELWDDYYRAHSFHAAPKENQVRRWIERYIPRGPGTCLEIGCFPGTYLAVFGERGYELNGIDLTPRVETDLPRWLGDCGFKVGSLAKLDFLDQPEDVKYTIVASFGFIEHFSNWEEVLKKHARLVDDRGYLVVSAPNFRGRIQNVFHRLLDRDNYDRHNIASMDPELWRDALRDMGFEFLYCGYFGTFEFWMETARLNFRQKIVFKILKRLTKVLVRMPEGRETYSPYCGLIARRAAST